jgi:hypothetical protein
VERGLFGFAIEHPLFTWQQVTFHLDKHSIIAYAMKGICACNGAYTGIMADVDIEMVSEWMTRDQAFTAFRNAKDREMVMPLNRIQRSQVKIVLPFLRSDGRGKSGSILGGVWLGETCSTFM